MVRSRFQPLAAGLAAGVFGAARRARSDAAGEEPSTDCAMWHGARLRLHAGARVAVAGADPDGPLGGLVEVVAYDARAHKWVLAAPRAGGSRVGVAEDRVALSHALLPGNGDAVEPFWGGVGLHDASQDRCGAGLATTARLEKGQPLFAEYPFVVAARSRADRWAAYVALSAAAAGGDGASARALQALDALVPTDLPSPDAERAARALVADALGPGAHDAEVARVVAVLRKYEANQFLYDDGGEEKNATALYRLVARMNHSCAPSVALYPERNAQNPGALVPGDGRLVAKALANLEPGEPLCICYGPADLIAWDLDTRRAYLAQHCGFRCVCARCLLEEEQAARSSR